MLFDDDEWPHCPDHGELKAWKKHPGGEGPHCVLTESEFPPSRGDGMQFLILGSGGL